MTIHEILKSYWGYDAFRPLQEEIITSVLEGKDTLALLPTGGGKSLCFQVPAMAMGGMCVVISPLIALMKDQVENLAKAGIRAEAIYSGLHPQEIRLILNNCIHGGVKFLYVSPERLSTETFKDALLQMKISLLAIDEAHCISQWGFDFRPEYRKIIEVREMLPKVPLIALTATATKKVIEDIQDQLGFKERVFFRKSFERLNLHYIIRHHENKLEKLLNSLTLARGSGLVYVRNRKKCEEIAQFLKDNAVNTSFYHAGLTSEERQQRQESWIQNKTRIMVCTNAFGMGIDKPDCRLVIHYEMPDCLEAYYQEAGRAGRNGEKAYCLLLYHPSDAEIMRNRLKQNFPSEDILRKVYDGICNFLHIPVGKIYEESYDFDIREFSTYLKINPVIVLSAIKILSQLGFIQINEAVYQMSRMKFLLQGNPLFDFQKTYLVYHDLIKILLRTYGGIFENYIQISEKDLAMKLNCSQIEIVDKLDKLQALGVIDYLAAKDKPQLLVLGEREKSEYLRLNPVLLSARKENEAEKLEAMIAYASNETRCRSRVLLQYFNEDDVLDCGTCDVCKERLGKFWTEEKLENLILQLSKLDFSEPMEVKQLTGRLKGFREEEMVSAFRILLDKGILQLNSQQLLIWTKRN